MATSIRDDTAASAGFGKKPTVSSVGPGNGPTTGGTPVTISGKSLTGATGVAFGTVALATSEFTVVSDTTIDATSPPLPTGEDQAPVVDVTVTTPSGTSPTSTADRFAYLTVAVVCPGSGPSTGGTAVTITGTGFSDVTSVAFGGVESTNVQVLLPTEIQATAPAPEGDGSSVVDVTVSISSGTSPTSSADQFQYLTGFTEVQVMMTLAALAASAATERPSGETAAQQAERILAGINTQLANAALATAGDWQALWVGLTQDRANLVYIAQNTASGTPQLAVCLRGTVMGSAIDTAEDMDVGTLLEFDAAGTPPSPVSISQGAMEAFTGITMGTTLLQTLTEVVAAQSAAPTIFVCGHSLGGALATTVSLYLKTQTFIPAPSFQVYTFAAPTAGDGAFASWFDTQFPPGTAATCVWNQYDAVPNAWWNLTGDQSQNPLPVEYFYPGMPTGGMGSAPWVLQKTIEGIVTNLAADAPASTYTQPTQQPALNQSFGCYSPAPSEITSVGDWEAEVAYQHANNTYLGLLGAPPLPAVAPSVASVSPTGGPATGWTEVTITAASGVVFTPDSVVDFGIVPATLLGIAGDGSTITALSPAGVGTVDVRVTNQLGTSAVVPEDQFAYASPGS